jgi:signal transduction histidine kinase
MWKRVIQGAVADSPGDFPTVIANMPITAQERRMALGFIIFLFIVLMIAGPFARVPAVRIDAFIPVIQTVMCIIDLITAGLLLSQYSIFPGHGVLAIASGYIFSGMFAFAQTLAFPGAYSATGLIGNGSDSAAWIFVLWHTSFPVAIIIYALSKDSKEAPSMGVGRSITITMAITVTCILAATAGLTWLVTVGVGYLPSLYTDVSRQTPLANQINIYLWLLSAAAFLFLLARRRTILDLWLMVVLLAWWPNFVVAIFTTVVRFSIGWYAARFFALVASSTLLFVLLGESTVLYARLAKAILLLRRERADRLLSVEAATGAISHELRQPLAAIATQGDVGLMLLEQTPPNLEEVGACLNSITRSSHRAAEIIASVRELFNQTPSVRTMIQVNDVTREVLSLVEHDLRGGEISVMADYQANVPKIHADHTQIQQVILNLIKNAIDAMRSSRNKRQLRLITGFDGDSTVSLYIQDTGSGIAAKDRERIFDPFFTTKPTGMGLGLSICRTMVEEHGGKLRLTKTGPYGSSFEVVLPIGPTNGTRT